jgi:hypothetical protein
MFRKLGFIFVVMLISGCGVGNAIDCHSICDRYKGCFDSSYNVDACASRCRTDSAKDSDYQRKADMCNTCIDERACTSATFNCATSCGSIVP